MKPSPLCLVYSSFWLIACTIINLQCLPVIEAFRISQNTAFRGRRSIPTPFSSKFFDQRCPQTCLFDKNQEDGEQVEVGTKEYYSGFISSPIQDETVAERGSGLEQALKLGGGVLFVLVFLVLGFMASNGLI